MTTLTRHPNNPILEPDPNNIWEHDGAFNGCVVFADGVYHMVYRALSSEQEINGVKLQVSTVGYAQSHDGVNFSEHRMLFGPTEDWEIYGCEDPRITYMDGKFYICYTALSVFPFAAYGIKLAIAVTTDFKTFEKHPVTPFNAKAMAIFPEKINGKMAALLTMNTDMPPAKIALAVFDKEEDIWSPLYWTEWYDNANQHIINLLRDMRDQVELGAPPIKTSDGWLVIYSYIKNYLSDEKIFGIEAVLLDSDNPREVLGRTEHSLIVPVEKYELEGVVANIVFPSGALVQDNKLSVYYGAADTRCAVATCDLQSLMDEIKPKDISPVHTDSQQRKLLRYAGNPILIPKLELEWQSLSVYNPAAIYLDGKVHILYRGQSRNGTSFVGYASSKDGFTIDENLDEPIYYPRESFEIKPHPEGNSGCEDPRITQIGDRIYITYTAYDGVNPPRVAMSSISVTNFLGKQWSWEKPKLISPPDVDDKDACVFKKVHGEGYLAFHRLNEMIWLDSLTDLEFAEGKYLGGEVFLKARKDKWDNVKIGIAGPPIETEKGWILLYHGVSEPGNFYKVGALLFDYDDPMKILGQTDEPILEPEMPYELKGLIPNVVFPCGQAVIDGTLFVYYGGGDSVVGVATMPLNSLLDLLLQK